MPEGITTIGGAVDEALCLILARQLSEPFRQSLTQLQSAIEEERRTFSRVEDMLRRRRAGPEAIEEMRRRLDERIGTLRRTFLSRIVALLAGK